MPSLLARALPHILAVLLYAGVAVFTFSPIFFEGKELYQHDILQGVGGGTEVANYREQGVEPYWTNSMFGGMPAYLINARYPGNLLLYVKRTYELFLPGPVNLMFTGLLSFYILLICSGVRPYLAIVGGLAYGLSSFILVSLEAGHNSKVTAMAYAPLVLSGVICAFRGKLWWGFALTALGLALHLSAGHLQITYYLLLMLLLFGLFKVVFSIKNGLGWPSLIKPVGLLVAAALLALLCNWGKLYDTYRYSKFSIRGPSELTATDASANANGLDEDYAFAWSNGIGESFTLLVPYFYGGASTEALDENSALAKTLSNNGVTPQQQAQFLQQVPTYWGDQPFTAGPIYLGAVVLLLFSIGLVYAPPMYRWWLVSAALLGLILSWGKNLEVVNSFLFNYLPGYNKFRAVTMALFLPMLAVPYLGFLGLEAALNQLFSSKKLNRTKLAWSIGVPVGLLVVLYGLSLGFSFEGPVDARLAQYPEWLIAGIRDQRAALLRGDVFRSLLFMGLAVVALWYFGWKKPSVPLLAASAGLLIFIDLYGVNNRYLSEEDFQKNVRRQYFAPTPADQAILRDEAESYRVLNLQNPWNEARTSYLHQSVGGYHGAKLRRYQELIDRQLTPELQEAITRLQQGSTDLSGLVGLNMLNTKYLIAGQQAEAVIPNQQAYGNAWAVRQILPVTTADQELEALQTLQSPERAVVNISQFSLQNPTAEARGQVTLTDYAPNRLTYTANLQSGGLVVFSEIYYPEGWSATIDGKPAPILRANYVLRALEVPEGKHTIELTFKPPLVGVYAATNYLSHILLLVAIGLAIWKEGWSTNRNAGTSASTVTHK